MSSSTRRVPSRRTTWVLVLGMILTGCQLAPVRPLESDLHPHRLIERPPPLSPVSPADAGDVVPVNLPNLPLPQIVSTPESNRAWPLGLREAVNIALRNSQVIRTLEGNSVYSTGVTNLDPAIADANRRVAIAAFDTTFNLNYITNQYNQPPNTVFGPGIPANSRRDDATLSTSLVKPWATGGTTSVAFNPSPGYLFFPNGTTGLFNPKYNSNIELFARQPLLKGAGVDVNRAPIRITQLKADQSIWDVKQATLSLVRSVEEAYWTLQATRAAFVAIEEVLPFIDNVVRVQEERLAEERTIRAEVAKARAQQATFRQARIEARSRFIAQELHLRNLLGLPPNDGLTIVPLEEPTEAPLRLDPNEVVRTAADNRPDLMRQRLGIRIAEMNLVVADNGTKPQFDLQALYRTNGLSDNVGDSLDMMMSNKFHDWTAGASFSVPIGLRAARANREAVELILARERVVLRQRLHATAHELGDLLRQLESIRDQYTQAKIRVEETEEWLEGSRNRYEDPPPGGDGQDWLLLALNDYLLAIRSRADSTTERALLLAQYNTLLAKLQETQGTLLTSYEIQLDGDPIAAARDNNWFDGSQTIIEPSLWNLDETPPTQAAPQLQRLPGRYGL